MKKYVFRSYSKIFPELFEKEKQRIQAHLKIAVIIEHIGSTAVPGLGGKGIIDIAIAAGIEELDLLSKQLQSLGYEYRASFSTADRLYFIADLPGPEEEIKRYHIHLTYPENSKLIEFLHFRDYLRTHPKELEEYAEIKKQAALEADNDGEIYRTIKEPIIKKICSLASNP